MDRPRPALFPIGAEITLQALRSESIRAVRLIRASSTPKPISSSSSSCSLTAGSSLSSDHRSG